MRSTRHAAPITGGATGIGLAAQLADEFWDDFQAEHFEMLIGKTKLLHWLRRLSPTLTDRIMQVQPGAQPAQRC
ncbi:hypothetical protein [Ideonella sp. A 288]|uniref:hypothetical protein n=1 Tax=Ideonella sp. A 288 TaxID=1962181 RepID=UPI001184A9A7|nr:hypothetical protein [Ideonella sp. A 288]